VVAKLVECLADPRYADKTFGVIVLQGTGQVKLLDLEIMAATTPEQREDHKIRVGTPPNFQGDERDVIFLSMVVADPPHLQAASMYQQAYNVAASRAKDQMWLFSSVAAADLKPGDLRASLMNYMLAPPSVYGASPTVEAVSATSPCEPFDSLFEQRVFREIRQRGYFAVPQYRVGTRSLDIVVVGAGGRLAVECDGHYWHTSPSQQTSDARRDRELRRMGWDVVRIRESEYEFDAARELAPLWSRLTERGIRPNDEERKVNGSAAWTPVDLPLDEADSREQEVFS
jgi:very-short-patch-repair endonuclease